MKRSSSVVRFLTVSTAAIGFSVAVPGCLGGLGETLSALLGIDILGVNPSGSFTNDGGLELSVLGRNDDGSVHDSFDPEDCDVVVEDDDGVEHECEWQGDDHQPGTSFSTITLLIDGSGSMEVTYPEEEYGDFCLTCPHDPGRVRVDAAQDFIATIGEAAPETVMGVMSFGPEPSEGWNATVALSDFTNNVEDLSAAVENVAGDEQAGTPLYDSLAELILATDDNADAYEAYMQSIVVDGNNNDVYCDPDDEGDDTIVVDGNNNTVHCQCNPNDTIVVDGNNNEIVCEANANPGDPVDPADPTDPQEPPVYDGEVERVILLLSDGEDRDSQVYDLEGVIELANQHDVTIYAIGLGPASASYESPLMQLEDQTPAITALQELASATGGTYASVHDADALRSLYGSIADGLTKGYNRTEYVCENPEAFTSGQRVHGTATCNGEAEAFSFVAP